MRKERVRRLKEELFKPSDDQLLVDWINDGERYTNGERLPVNNLKIN